MVVGNGENTLVWKDQWLSQKPARKSTAMRWNEESIPTHYRDDMKVSELLIFEGRECNSTALERLFPEEKRLIEKIRPCGKRRRDLYVWDYTKTGLYSVKSGYWVQMNVLNSEMKQVESDQPSLDMLYQMAWKA